MKKILIGCDPEVFVKMSGMMTSAHGLIPGTKENPYKVENGAVQVDGMALEFNIDPADSENQFCFNVNSVIHQLSLMVPNHEIVIQPVAHFSKEVMDSQPPEALELGCDPDYNAWTMEMNQRPDGDRPMRTASGHIHVGWRNPDEPDEMAYEKAGAVARQLDFYLGLGSLFYDKDTERRTMYGNPGCFRVKPYGMEYRTLSNAWLRSDNLIRWAYRNARKGIEDLMDGRVLTKIHGDIQHIIKNSDLNAAEKIIKKENLEIVYG